MAKQLYGRGSVEEIIKGKKYRIQQPCGKDPVTGKYRRIRETFLGTKRQAEKRLEQIRHEIERGKAVNADKITTAEWVEKYLAMREGSGKYRPKTLKQDRSQSKRIIAALGAVAVVDVTPAMIDELIASMRREGVGDTTVKQTYKLLKRIMGYAAKNDIILRNPVERAESPKKPKPQRHALSTKDANRLVRICVSGKPTANRTAVYIALATGARLGEVLGLTWNYVALDCDRPFVQIVQQFTEQGEPAPLKTDKDDNPDPGRIVPLDASTVAVLKAWKSEQVELLNQFGIEQGSKTPVITNQLGKFTSHSRFQRWWRSFCVDNGFGRMVTDDGRQVISLTLGDDAALYPESEYLVEWRDSDGWPYDESGKRYSRSHKRPKTKRHYEGLHFHELRHTHFTMRLAAGTDIPTAQALGGWSTPDVLLRVYAHPTPENVWSSAGFMDKLTAKQTA